MPNRINTWNTELDCAREAWHNGNDGRSRVCCRRAVGIVIAEYNQLFPGRRIEGHTAIDKIRTLSVSEHFPAAVSKAARRLTVNIRDRLKTDFSFFPVNDAEFIINYFLENHLNKLP